MDVMLIMPTDGWNSLHWAAFKRSIEILQMVIPHISNVNQLTSIDKKSALSLALEQGHAEIVDHFIKHYGNSV